MKKIIILTTCLFVSAIVAAQISADAELKQQLKGKTKFYDIRNTVDNFYTQKISSLLSPIDSLKRKKLNRQTKFWNRWFYESESRLNSNGEVENVTQKLMQYQNTTINSPLTSQGSWSHVGPNNVTEGIGRINRIAVDPSTASTLYAGSSGGGLYKTVNGGISWTNVASYLPSLGISGIVLTSSNTIYILTGDGDAYSSGGFTFSFGYIRNSVGVLKSTDGGNTWVSTGDFPGLANERYCGMRLVRDPNNANILMAATTHGLYRTTNGGNSWSLCSLGNSADNVMVYDVRYAPGSSTFVYCTIRSNNNDNEGTFLRSTDGGLTFPSSNTVVFSPNSFTNVERIGIGVTPNNPDLVYLLAGPGNESSGSFKGLWKSTDKGANFTRQSNTPDVIGTLDFPGYGEQNMYDLAIAVSPTNANVVIVAGLVIFKSTSGGVLFGQETPYHGSTSIHPDVHDLVYASNGNLYAASDGGVAVSSDNGSTWSKIFSGLSCTQFYHFEPANEDGYVWGGAQDNGILIRNGTTSTFDRFDGGDGYDVLTDVAPAGNYDDKWWVVNRSIWADGVVSTEVTPSDVDMTAVKNYFPNLAMSPTNEDVIYAGYPALHVSYSRGDNWADFESPTLPHYKIPGNWSVSACPTNRKRFYTAGDTRTSSNNRKGLWRLDNLDDFIPDEITDLTSNLVAADYPSSHPKITDIAVSSNTSNRLWVTVGGFNNAAKIFYSNNAGANWVNISGSLPNFPINTIVADDNDNVYIGTDIGVYYKGVNEADWTPFYNGLPRVPVSELEFYTLPGNFTFLYAATYGRGIWVSEIFSNCVSDLTISSNQIGQKFYQAGSTINTTSSITGGTGTNVFFRAGTSVTLEPGFIVNPATEFTAYIGPCNSGPVPFKSITGDSSINVAKNIKSARQYGFVNNAVTEGENTTVTVNIFNPGNYTIRLYDVDARAYISSQTVTLTKGINQTRVQAKVEKDKFIRADLFKDEMLVHYTDVSKK